MARTSTGPSSVKTTSPDSGRDCPSAGWSDVFTKADALKAFLHIHLTEESSKLLMINTHKGRYRFKRMPFGAKMSQTCSR